METCYLLKFTDRSAPEVQRPLRDPAFGFDIFNSLYFGRMRKPKDHWLCPLPMIFRLLQLAPTGAYL